jgi:hypothetical protein
MPPFAILEALESLGVVGAHHNCQHNKAEPLHQLTAVSEAKMGVLAALSPIPSHVLVV